MMETYAQDVKSLGTCRYLLPALALVAGTACSDGASRPVGSLDGRGFVSQAVTEDGRARPLELCGNGLFEQDTWLALWHLAGIAGGGTVRPVETGIATLRFDGGRVEVLVTTCHDGSTTAEITARTIRFGALELNTWRNQPCAHPDVGPAIAAALRGEVRYDIDAITLTLTGPDGHGLHLLT